MKKSFVFTAALLMGLAVTGCSKQKVKNVTVEDVKAKGTFVMGLDDAFPPMGFRDKNNEIVGYDIDLASKVAEKLGVKLVTQPISWSAKEQELSSGKIDCIWNGFTITDERNESMAMTKPYLNNAQVVVVNDSSNYKTLADLAGKTVGVQKGSSAREAIEAAQEFKASLASVIEFDDNVFALNDLEINKLDAVVMDVVVADYTIKTGLKTMHVLEESLAPEGYGIGFRKGSESLRDSVWQILVELQNDGTVSSISDKWFGEDRSVIAE